MKLFFWVKPKNNISNAGKYGPEKTPYLDTFHAVISSINFHGFSIFIYGIKITSITSVLDELACFFAKKLVLWRSIVPNVKAKISQQPHFFQSEFSQTLTFHWKAREEKTPYLFLPTISTRSQIFKHLFAV